jgi:hypothetical protein
MTIRETINEYRNKIRDCSNLGPSEASKYLVELSALTGNVNEELLKVMMDYNYKKSEFLTEIKSVAKAEVKAQCTEEYRRLQEVKGYRDLIVELIRSLKYFLRSLEDERSFSKHL